MRTRKNRKIGGKVLGRGTAATVIYPAIPCRDGRDMTSYVSRVVGRRERNNPNVDLVSNNTTLVKKLKKVDPKQKYLLYPTTCKSGSLLPENIEDGATDTSLSELYKKAGIRWRDYISNNTATEHQMKHILVAIKKLHDAKIIHGDLKNTNIVMGDDDLPRLIDFGSALYDVPQEYIDIEKKITNLIYPSFSFRGREGEAAKIAHDFKKLRRNLTMKQRGY